MENEKDLSDSEMESDLKEDIVFGKLSIYVLTVLKMFDILL